MRPLERHDDEAELAARGLAAPFVTCDFDICLRRS